MPGRTASEELRTLASFIQQMVGITQPAVSGATSGYSAVSPQNAALHVEPSSGAERASRDP